MVFDSYLAAQLRVEGGFVTAELALADDRPLFM